MHKTLFNVIILLSTTSVRFGEHMTAPKYCFETNISPERFAAIYREVKAILELGKERGYADFFGTVLVGSWEYGGGPFTWEYEDDEFIAIDGVEHEWSFDYATGTVLTPGGWMKIECSVTEWCGSLGIYTSLYHVYFDSDGNVRRITRIR